jgi:hypothetical protein
MKYLLTTIVHGCIEVNIIKKLAVSFGVFGKRYVYTIGKDIIVTITRMTARPDFAGKVCQTFTDIRVSQIK